MVIASAYFSPPTRQPFDAAEPAHGDGAAGFPPFARGCSAASAIAPVFPTRTVERHGADGAPAQSPSAPSIEVAALYVATGGIYFGRDDVDPWDESRDARLYEGPYPVVAHPPCARWSSLAYLNQAQHGYKVGDDDGCFAAALAAVRMFGGVLEHPAQSIAWARFGLTSPIRGAWIGGPLDHAWVTEVSQSAYGHRARKRTWLYYVGDPPAPLDWSDPEPECKVSDLHAGTTARDGRKGRPRMYQREALSTPPAFADVLLSLARGARL